jgi:hypothetical protein
MLVFMFLYLVVLVAGIVLLWRHYRVVTIVILAILIGNRLLAHYGIDWMPLQMVFLYMAVEVAANAVVLWAIFRYVPFKDPMARFLTGLCAFVVVAVVIVTDVLQGVEDVLVDINSIPV